MTGLTGRAKVADAMKCHRVKWASNLIDTRDRFTVSVRAELLPGAVDNVTAREITQVESVHFMMREGWIVSDSSSDN